MNLVPPDFFQSYLNSVCQHYAQWWRVYTLTDVVGQASTSRSITLPMWDLGLRVQTINHDKDPRTNESKTERFTVLEGLRKYAADHVLLVGRPGSGKSTALARLLIEEAQKVQQDSSALIPVLVELRYYQDSVLELMRSFFKTHGLLLDRSTIETLLFEGRFLLLVDGLNELPSEDARREMNVFEQTNRKTPMIFTTRDLGVGGDLNLTRKLEMQSLTEKQMQAFIRSYLPTQGDALLRQLGDRLREFGQTPMLLWMLCSVFANNQNRVPSNLGSVFREFTQIHYCKLKEDVPVAEGSREYWAEMLQVLAWKMTQGKSATELQVAIDRNEAIQSLKAFLTGRVAYPETYARNRLSDLLKHHLIQLGAGAQIEFRHQLIQEYYTAEQLLNQLPQLNDECLKWDYLNYLKWTEPFALMLELVEDKQEALRVMKLVLEVDWQLGARLAGKVKLEWQEEAIEMVRSLQLPQLFKIHLLGVTRSEAAISKLLELLKSRDCDVQWSAAAALWEIGSDEAVPALIEHLKHGYSVIEDDDMTQPRYYREQFKDKDLEVHQCIAGALGKIGSDRAVQTLIEGLKSGRYKVRQAALYGLYQIDSDRAVPTLIELIKSEEHEICSAAIYGLGRIGSDRAVPALIELLKDKEYFGLGEYAANALGKIGSDRAIPALIELIKKGNNNAANALGKIGSDRAISALIELLKNKDERRYPLADALGETGSDRAVPPLIELLEDSIVRFFAADALGKIGSDRAVPPLLELLKDEDSNVGWSVVRALGKIGSDKAVPPLIERLKDEDSDVRGHVVRALGEIGSDKAVPPLLELLKDEDFYSYGCSDVRGDVARALGEIGSDKAVPPLLELLKNENSKVCEFAIDVLGEIGSDRAVPVLIERLKDKNYRLRSSVAHALGRIGSDAAVPMLIELLRDEDEKWRAARSLGKVRSDATVLALIEGLKDEDYSMREIVAEELCKIASEANIFQLKQCMKNRRFDTNEIYSVLTAIQNRCKRYNAQPATSTEKQIAPQAKTSDRPSEPAIVHQHFYDKVYGVAGNVEGNQNIQPPASNSDTTDL